jgi:hypothetical protein
MADVGVINVGDAIMVEKRGRGRAQGSKKQTRDLYRCCFIVYSGQALPRLSIG